MGDFPFSLPSGAGATVITPTGTAAGDAAKLNPVLAGGGHVILAAGAWNFSGISLSAQNTWLQGSGPATQITVPAGVTGLTVALTPGQNGVYVSDMSFAAIGAGSLGLAVNGAADSWYERLYFSGSSAAGGVAVNGDDATEQHWTDCVFRNVGGTCFAYTRTTTSDTGGMYLDRLRCVSPPHVTGTHGFSFTASGGNTPVNLFMDECVADSYYDDAALFQHVTNIRVDNSWFGLSGTTGSPVHITGGYNITTGQIYTFMPYAGFDILIDGGAHDIQIGAGTVFDGTGGATALGLSAAGGNIKLGTYNQFVGTLTDTPTALANNLGAAAPVTFQVNGSGGSGNSLGLNDTSSPGNQVWVTNAGGAFKFINTAFSASMGQVNQDGTWTMNAVGSSSGGRIFGPLSGAPGLPNGIQPSTGDFYFRKDTPSTANQRLYVCTAGGGTPTWVGIL